MLKIRLVPCCAKIKIRKIWEIILKSPSLETLLFKNLKLKGQMEISSIVGWQERDWWDCAVNVKWFVYELIDWYIPFCKHKNYGVSSSWWSEKNLYNTILVKKCLLLTLKFCIFSGINLSILFVLSLLLFLLLWSL